MDVSADFGEFNADAADHDDIDFDINTPREGVSIDLSKGLELDDNSGRSNDKNCVDIPSIVIIEPSSANLASLDDLMDAAPDNEVKADPDISEPQASPENVEFDLDIKSTDDNREETVVDERLVSPEDLDFKKSVENDVEVVTDEITLDKNNEVNVSGENNRDIMEVSNETNKPDSTGTDAEFIDTGKEDASKTIVTASGLDVEKEVNDIRQNVTTEVAQSADSQSVKPEVRVASVDLSDNFTDLNLAQSVNLEKQEPEEVEEAVSLDNILMKDKTESDSDDEFDFDLPTAPQSQAKQITESTPTSLDTKITSKVEPSVSSVSAAPSVPRDTQVPVVGSQSPSGSSSETQRLVPSKSTDQSAGFPSPQTSSSSTQKPVAVIKPTSQSPYVVQAPPDEGTQQVLEAAQAEWDNVTTIQAGFKATDTNVQGAEPTVIQTVEPMSPHELLEIFKHEDFSDVRSGIKPSLERHGFSAFVNFLFGPPKLHRDLIAERDTVFCIAAAQLSNENSAHIRTLQTIYRCLTGSKFDCPRMGSHWEQIGFQGNDPATDLRGAGLLGLMNLLHILKDNKKYQLASDIYRLSLHPTQNFPFCIMGINLSRITLQTLREGLLNKECNRRHEVIGVVNDFYTGLYLQLYKVWKGQGKTISDSGFVIKDIEMRAKKSPRDVLKNLDDFLNKKTVLMTQKSTDSCGDDFVNVCDDK